MMNEFLGNKLIYQHPHIKDLMDNLDNVYTLMGIEKPVNKNQNYHFTKEV